MRSKYVGMIALVVLVAVIGLWYNFSNASQRQGALNGTQPNDEVGVSIGKTAPGFTLTDLEGKTVQVGNHGKIYVLNFWASWCPPCRAELPDLAQFVERHGAQVQFYGINIQEPEQKVAEFLQQNNYKIPVLFDKDGTVAHTFRISSIPTTIVIDTKGMIYYRKLGGITLGELESIIKEIGE